MSDELVKRLQDFGHVDAYQASDRIKTLEARMEHWRRESDRAIHELTARAQLAEEWRDHDKERAEAAEAQVASLVESLQCIADLTENASVGYIARAAIASAKATR